VPVIQPTPSATVDDPHAMLGVKAISTENAFRQPSFMQQSTAWGGASSFHTQSLTRAPQAITVSDVSTQTIGKKPWWTFYDEALPGIGSYSINLQNGNTLIQQTDLHIHHRDVDFVFTRTANSLSRHDANNSDGTGVSHYGDGWTSTLDERIIANNSGGLSIIDATGARWDYTSDGKGNWIAPAGVQATLVRGWITSYPAYIWRLPDGTIKQFYSPYTSDFAANTQGLKGLIGVMFGRCQNNWHLYHYNFANNDSSKFNNLVQIIEQSEDGTAVNYNFTSMNGVPELTQLVRPDGNIVYYAYTGNAVSTSAIANMPQAFTGNLLSAVAHPGSAQISNPKVALSYYPGTYEIYYVQNPRSVISGNTSSLKVRLRDCLTHH
jgi:hypothetical protein